MSLRIIKSGVMDTVQDGGRYGYQYLGINPGGVMDGFAARTANTLVGNPSSASVLELHFPASDFFFEQPCLISICGADFAPHLNGEEIPLWQPVIVSRFSILQFNRLRSGARAYLAIYKGLDIPKWFNSYSTHLKAGAGGHNGKALQKEDEIPIANVEHFQSSLGRNEFQVLPWKASVQWGDPSPDELLILPGKEWNTLDAASQDYLSNHSFELSSQSDRMGYRLKGNGLTLVRATELISSAVSFGTVQLLPDGQLIILMADHQTTGGYPRIAHVITAHHSKLAQKSGGDLLRFRVTTPGTAEELLIKQQQHLLQVENACKFKLEEILHLQN
jgi:antagonist of KipI